MTTKLPGLGGDPMNRQKPFTAPHVRALKADKVPLVYSETGRPDPLAGALEGDEEAAARAGARSIPHPNAMRGNRPKNARVTTDAERELREGNTAGKHLFRFDPSAKRWLPMRDDDVADVRSGNVKFYILTDADMLSLIGRDVKRDEVYSDHDMHVVDRYLTLRNAVMDNPVLTDAEKTKLIREFRDADMWDNPYFIEMAMELATTDDPVRKRWMMEIETDLVVTFGLAGGGKPMIMQRPTGSVFYKVREAFKQQKVHIPLGRHDPRDLPRQLRGAFSSNHHIFVLEHNWAGAFSNAKDFDGGELQLPYPACAFEFQYNDRRIVISMSTCPPGTEDLVKYGIEIAAMVAIQTPSGWCMPGCFGYANGKFFIPRVPHEKEIADHVVTKTIVPLMTAIQDQIKAVLVSLEAKVSTTEVVRAAYKLNAKREKVGKPPLLDYHVVSLARRTRPERLPLAPGHEPHHRVRCHFRRGHWRHYEHHKTYIEWMLVGDPDLGFIDKEYRL